MASNPTSIDAAGTAAAATAFPVKEMAALADAVETTIAEARNPQPPCPRGYTRTERALFEQLTESTGTHLCDSGFPGGRRWERNRKNCDFRGQPFGRISLEFGLDCPTVGISPFHRLREHLSYDAAMNRKFSRFAGAYDHCSDLSPSEAFAKRFGTRDPVPYSSYGDEYSVLSQDLVFDGFEADDGSSYVLLSMHNGADARIGYTEPVAYAVGEIDVLVYSLQSWTASCMCPAEVNNFQYMEMRCGEFDSDGLQEWPEHWKVSPADGTARCGVCAEAVNVY